MDSNSHADPGRARKNASIRRPQLSNAGLDPTHNVTATNEFGQPVAGQIAGERPLTIYLDRQEIVTLMTLGTHPELLTLGYLRNQGLIEDIDTIASVQVDWETDAVAVTTRGVEIDWDQRLGRRMVTTGCGQGTVFSNILEQLDNTHLSPLILKQSGIYALLHKLKEYNAIYRSAGAVHGCALCQGDEIRVFIEDVGRHNAVDAIAGLMWLEGTGGADKLFYTTGRLTSEMVIKVSQMGVPALLSRSGITQMGLDLARKVGITLLARAKGRHFLIYNGAENLVYDAMPPDHHGRSRTI